MKNSNRKVKASFFSALFLLASAFLTAEDWYVCLGGYSTADEAAARVSDLTESGIPAQVREFGTEEASRIYRVLLSQKMESKENALFIRRNLLGNPRLRESLGDNVWIVSISQEKYVGDPSKRILSIKDSDTGLPIADANVNIDEKWDVPTNSEGQAKLPGEITDGEHRIAVTKDGEYVPTSGTFSMDNGEISTAPQFSIPKAVDYERIKIILDWGENPADLDSHIFSSDRHVYFSNMNSGNMSLDIDDRNGFGPETITVKEPSESEKYEYYVFNYSDGGNLYSERLANSEAQVRVYFNNEYAETFKISPNQRGLWWHVFDIVNNEIVPVDMISNSRD